MIRLQAGTEELEFYSTHGRILLQLLCPD